jgi:CRISPR-associated protein Csx17
LKAKPAEIEDQANRERWSTSKRKDSIKKFFDSLLLIEIDGQTISLEKAGKDEFLARLRGEILEDDSLKWLDAALVLLTGQKKNRLEAPFLGSGGNIGNSDFSARFMQVLPTVIPLEAEAVVSPQSGAWLCASLWSEAARDLLNYSVDQFDPGRAGSANMGQGLSAEPFLNPWDYILMIEGALLLGGTVAKRLGAHRERAVFPFSADSSLVGFASAGVDDTRGELWLPIWERHCSIRELKLLFGEGRAELGRRSVRTGVDFTRAAVSLGVDRGLTAFVRYQFQKRLGDNYLANSLGKLACRQFESVDLLRELDPWLDRFCRACADKKVPPRLKTASRRIEAAIFELCQYGKTIGGEAFFQAILIALGQAERELALSAGKIGMGTILPITNLTAKWAATADDKRPEFEVALALSGIYDGNGKIGPLRSNLEPVLARRNESGRFAAEWYEKDHAVVWNSADLSTNLAAVLSRRFMDGERNCCMDLPLSAVSFVSLNTVSRFLAGGLNEQRIEALLWGLILLQQMPGVVAYPNDDTNAPPLPRAFALLKLLFLPNPLWVNGTSVTIKPDPSVVTLLTARHVGEACRIAMRRLRACIAENSEVLVHRSEAANCLQSPNA